MLTMFGLGYAQAMQTLAEDFQQSLHRERGRFL